jgi:hypothetical protein
MAEHYDALAGWAYHRDGGLTLRDWLRSVRRVEERAWFHGDDLWPFVVMSLRFLLRGIERTVGKCGRRDRAVRAFRVSCLHSDRERRPRYIGP